MIGERRWLSAQCRAPLHRVGTRASPDPLTAHRHVTNGRAGDARCITGRRTPHDLRTPHRASCQGTTLRHPSRFWLMHRASPWPLGAGGLPNRAPPQPLSAHTENPRGAVPSHVSYNNRPPGRPRHLRVTSSVRKATGKITIARTFGIQRGHETTTPATGPAMRLPGWTQVANRDASRSPRLCARPRRYSPPPRAAVELAKDRPYTGTENQHRGSSQAGGGEAPIQARLCWASRRLKIAAHQHD